MACSHAQSGFLSFFFFFGLQHIACGISVPSPGIDLVPSVVKACSPNHWTTREFSEILHKSREDTIEKWGQDENIPAMFSLQFYVTAFQNYTVFSECALLSHCIISQMTFPSPSPSVEFLASFKT